MTGGARVHRLRLRATHDDDVRRGAILIGEALRVATMPEARSARHFVVRHLEVGTFARDAAPQTVALMIERRVAAAVQLAVAANAPGAEHAPAVWFADHADAIGALAERVALGRPLPAWYWRQLAGGALGRGATDAILDACLAAAADGDGAPRALAQVVDRTERARAGAILGPLTTTRAAALFTRAFGEALPARSTRLVARPSALRAWPSALAPVWRLRLATWLPRWDGDARAVGLIALALVDSGAAPASMTAVVALARQLVDAIAADTTPLRARERVASAAPSAAEVSGQGAPAAGAAVATSPVIADALVSTTPSTGELRRPSTAAPAATAFAPARARPAASRPSAIVPEGETAAGGLLFLVRPLAHLELPGWIDRHAWAASSAFAARLLAGIARDHGAAQEDPLAAALVDDEAAVDPGVDRPLVRRAWGRALERWLARHTVLTLDELVRRPARVAWTRTHLDVCFRLRDADVRIRLAGLDIDPGWVPWLGRVVRFHYEGAA